MRNTKGLLLASLFVLTTLIANGQGFEWVKAYSGTDRIENMNQIKGSFVDAQGNIYIVGNMSAWGEILGVELLPREINRGAYNRQCVVIAKISPDGQLVWHKPIYSSGYDSYAQALSRMGDTAFMVMCRVSMKHYYDSYPPSSLYFLDTMLTSADEGYLTLKDSTWCSEVSTFFITFDFDGNVREHHILEIGYIDSSGTAITLGVRMNNPSIRYANALCTVGLSHETFTIDHDGNIYVIRNAGDQEYMHGNNNSTYTISIQDGAISALKIMVDGRRSFVHQLDMPSPLWNQQILKFSPHFDSLMGGVYLFDSTYRDSIVYSAPECFAMNVDRNNNIYALINASRMPSQRMYINNSDSLSIRTIGEGPNSFVVVYNSDMRAIDIIQPIPDDNDPRTQIALGEHIYFDNESNSIFLPGGASWFTGDPIFLYGGDTIPIPINRSVFWLRLDMDSHNLLSYGFARPPNRNFHAYIAHVAAKNNRVFSQIKYAGLTFADTTLNATYAYDIAFAVWDYDGHDLMVKNYNVDESGDITGQIHIVDSAVYLTGTLHMDATFDTITLRGTGHSQAYVARYVDTAFMHPYVYHETHDTQTIVWQQGLTHWLGEGRVALTATSTSGLPVCYTYNNSSVAQVRGGDTLYFLAAGDVTVTARQYGNAQYQPAIPVRRTFHIDPPEPQSITWTQELDHRLAEGHVLLTASATSGLPVSYSCGDNGVAQVRGDTLVLLAAGDATVTARQEGDVQYAAAEPVSRTFHIEAPEPQSITWTQELDLGLAEGRVALTATATSGLPVSYSCSNSGVAQVRGDTLVLLATGTATVTARQEGDARYAAAEPVSKTLRVSAEGIGEAAAEGLTIYPNPTTGVVHVGCDGCTVKEATVVTPQGRSERVACRDGRIDLSHLAAGVYYLEVRTDTGVRREKVTKL